MPVNDQQFNAQQDRVRKLAESYEGAEKKEVAELYVDRIARLKTAIMESKLTDSQKEDYLKRLDNYLRLVDANNLQRLKKEYEPLLKSMEATLPKEVQEQAADDREARLEGVADLKIRQELLGEWREAIKFREKYESKKKQLDLLIKTKKLEVEGTELQYFMTSIEFHTDFLNSKLKEYYDTGDVGQKHEKLKEMTEQGETFYAVLTSLEERLREVKSQEDLQVIDLNDRNVLAEQMMFVKRKRYEDNKQEFLKKLDAMKIPKEDPIRKHMMLVFEAADNQFDTHKEEVMTAKTPEERTVAAEQAVKLLDQANEQIEGANKFLNAVNIKNAVDRGWSAAKIFEQSPLLKKLTIAAPIFIMPQFAVGLGYYEAAHKGGGSSSDTALEVLDFGISMIPIAGGAYDVFAAIRGKTLSGREMGTAERIVRGVIGVGSIVLDIFTFGVGGALAKAGGKAAIKAGAEITAKATAKAALEASAKGGAKVAAKEGAEAGAKVIAKEGAEAGAKAIGEGAAKEVGETAAKEVVEGAAKEASAKVAVALTEAQKEIILKGTRVGASAAERAAARSVLKEVVHESLKASAKELGAKQAAKLAEQTAKIATRKTTGLAGFGYRRLAGFSAKWGQAGEKGLEKGIVIAGAEKATTEAALKAGKRVIGPYYLQAKFVKEGEVLWGGIAKSVGKDAAKMWWHMHNPFELLKVLQTPGRFLSGLFKRYVKGVPGNLYASKAALEELEQSAKATLIADGHNAKDLDLLFQDVKQKPWDQVMKEQADNPLFKDKDIVEFFKGFSEQYPKGLSAQMGAMSDLYKGFKELEPDTIVSAKMAYDSRRMEWKDFYQKYKDNLRTATPEQLRNFESQFTNLQSMSREMPVNVAKVKAEREAGKEALKLSKEQVDKLQTELNDQLKKMNLDMDTFKTEKGQLEEFMRKYSDGVTASGGKKLSQTQQTEMLFEGYSKFPDGPLKKSIEEARGELLKQLGKEVKADSAEFKQATAQAVRTVLPDRVQQVMSIEERIARIETAKTELGMRETFATNVSKPKTPQKLEQKENVVEMGERRAREAEEATAAAMAAQKAREAEAAKKRAEKEAERKAKEAANAPKTPEAKVVPIQAADLARKIARERLMKSIPADLAKKLSPEQLNTLRINIGNRGKTAAIREMEKLGMKATEAQMRKAGEKAFDQVANKEIEAMRRAVEGTPGKAA
jgi:hypothetical protein